jgi:hypothetical protein
MDSGFGHLPTTRHFRGLRRPLWLVGAGVHENPRFQKHFWRVWGHLDVIPDDDVPIWRQTWEPQERISKMPELCFADAIELMRTLRERGELFFVTNQAVRRDDPDLPWDFAAMRARGARLAPAYDADTDRPFFGHK